MFDRSALNDGVRPREVFAWSMYDFANSGYTTVVLTAVFNAYFVGVVARGVSWGTFAWTAALSFSSLLIMLTAPAIGAWADDHASKKRLMMLSTVGCVAATAGLGLAQPGGLALALVLIVVSNYFFAMGETLNAAFLPELARSESMGKVSGWGWSFGYVGGMLTLGLSLAWVLGAPARGSTASEAVPATMLITAAVFALAAIPTFAWLRERQQQAQRSGAATFAQAMTGSVLRLARVWREAGDFPDFSMFLWCVICYQAGIAVVIALAAIYAQEVMGFQQSDTMMLIFLVNIAAAIGAFCFGYVQDRIGHRVALALTLCGWILMVALAGLTRTLALFWLAAVLAGLCMGSAQSAGRAMIGLLAPAARLGEFFGLWAFATRLASVIGPITYGILVTFVAAGDHRTSILISGMFFVAGLVVLVRVDLERGRRAAIALS